MRTASDLIGIAFLNAPPEGLPRSDARDPYCSLIGRARREGAFWVPAEAITCPLARFHLGIDEPDYDRVRREILDWPAPGAVQRFLDSGERMAGEFGCVTFLPYPSDKVEPDVLIAVVTAERAMELLRQGTHESGERISASISGVGAACGECTAYALIRGRPTVSLACGGSRPAIGMQPGEVLLAAPAGATLFSLLADSGL